MPSQQPKSNPGVGEPVDLARFANVRVWRGTEKQDLTWEDVLPGADGSRPMARDGAGPWHLGLEWDDPRDVRRIVVRFAGAVPPGVKVQYWRKNWPTPAPQWRRGARRGWIGRDDPWHGVWTTVRAETRCDGGECAFTFDPVDIWELGGRASVEQLAEAEHYLARFRRTLKVRIIADGEAAPMVAELHAYGTDRWQEMSVDVHTGIGNVAPARWDPGVEAVNGVVLGVTELSDPQGAFGSGLRLRLLATEGDQSGGSRPSPIPADRTIVTIRKKSGRDAPVEGFSFLPADLARGPIWIRDLGALITEAGAPAEVPPSARLRQDGTRKSIYERVEDEPEQSLQRALAEIPPLDVVKQEPSKMGRYLPLALDAGRQEWAVRYNGELFADRASLKPMGRDTARLIWPSAKLRFRFGTGDPPDFRERRDGGVQSVMEGWLPVVITRWLDREIAYEETAFVAPLDGPMTPPEARRGDEDIAALVRLTIRNTTHGRKQVRLWIVVPQEQLRVWGVMDDEEYTVGGVGRIVPADPVARQWQVERYEVEPLRCILNTGGLGTLDETPFADVENPSVAIPTALLYTIELDGGASHGITLKAPFAGQTDRDAYARLAMLDYDRALEDVANYWRELVEPGGQMELPDTLLSELHKSIRTHVAITSDKDPISGLTAVPAATYDYGVCANEACWQITMFDQAGHHDRAETYLETFLATQGMSQLDGNFASNEGLMQGLDFDDGVPLRSHFAYNLDPGYIMECLADHYRLTGDRDWLARVAPKLVAACDFIIRERQRTKEDGAPHWGLMPAGHLEDNPEWRYWFAVNAHAYGGMKGVADVLAEIDHPDAARLAEEAATYRVDIRRAARRALAEAPVVQLLDGTYIPRVPTRAGLRGRDWGWFREAAYGALHLCESSVFDPNEPEMTWTLKDLEDNLFVSRDWGRPVDLEKFWFSQGGVTIQANLMDLAIDYLRRGQVKHGLRALFNNFGASTYTDVRCFTEHPVVELGHGVGPFYKSSDEAKALVWLRAFLIREESDVLHLAPGAPRAYFEPGQSFGVRDMATYFGPLTYRIEGGQDQIEATISTPERRPPAQIVLHLRLPEGRRIASVTVNGSAHAGFDAGAETVTIPSPRGALEISANTA